MSVAFAPYGVYEDIINLLGRWRVLDMKSLSKMCNYDIQYHNLLHKVRKLEKQGYVQGVLMGRKNKHIYLTDKGLKYAAFEYKYKICDETLTHDLIVGNVLRSFIACDYFIDGRMYPNITGDKLLPDAEVSGKKNEMTYKMAIEVELTQKEQTRVKEKYRQYGLNSMFNYVLFITNKEALFKAYRSYLLEMKPEVQEGVILLLDEKLTENRFDFEKSKLFYMSNEHKFLEFFG